LKYLLALIKLLLIVLVSSCAIQETHQHAEELAHRAGLEKSIITANGFVLTSYSRMSKLDQPINVYVEGDGLAWLSRHELSADPTPRMAIGLELASLDSAKNVVYLARPCQFNNFNQTPCDSAYWSNKRFSEKVINAMNYEVDSFVRKTHAQKVNLIGYSGGGTVAVLLAARRNDIASLITVAGNLDHAYVNEIHNVDLMPESLNAIDVANKISSIPQLHFVGRQDKVIPKEVALRFIGKQNHGNCATLIDVEAGHQDAWVKQWPLLLNTRLPCRK
jgi:hypothetical protein